MKARDISILIREIEQQIDAHLQEAISVYQNMKQEDLLRPAANGGWSIAQCLEHLNSYGDFYLPEIKKAIEKHTGKAHNTSFKSTWLGNYFTQMMKPGKGKKMKAFKNHIPKQELDAWHVVAEFIQQQETLLQYLRLSAGAMDVRVPISISRWIRLKLGDVFQFLIAHDDRHLVQAKRNVKR